MREGARLYAEKLNKAKGLVKFLVPLRGWSSIDKPGSVLYNPNRTGILRFILKNATAIWKTRNLHVYWLKASILCLEPSRFEVKSLTSESYYQERSYLTAQFMVSRR